MESLKESFASVAPGDVLDEGFGSNFVVEDIGRKGQQGQQGNWVKVKCPDGGSLIIGEKDFKKWRLKRQND
jgi:hypothetical protein